MCIRDRAIVLAGVCFIPVSLNLLANSLTSLACGIQVESFRKIHGNGIATTMLSLIHILPGDTLILSAKAPGDVDGVRLIEIELDGSHKLSLIHI